MGAATARVMMLEGPEKLVMREFDRPKVGPDDGILKVGLAGLCGTDVKVFHGKLSSILPIVPGHEIMGTIDEVGERAAKRWNVKPGDTVIVEPTVPCYACRACYTGNARFCPNKTGYGTKMASDKPPYFLGGYAEIMYLLPGTIIHKIASHVPWEAAVLSTGVVANGIQWARNQGVRFPDVVVVQGCGPQGIACAAVSKLSGASLVMMTGTDRDAERLALAKEFGADHTVDVTKDDPVEVLRDLTKGAMADKIIDVSGSPAAWPKSVKMVRPQGKIIQGGLSGKGVMIPVELDELVWNEIQVQGVFTKGPDAVADSIKLLESGIYPWEKVISHKFTLDQAEHAVRAIGGEVEGLYPIKAAISPN